MFLAIRFNCGVLVFEEELMADIFKNEVYVFVFVIDVVMYKIDCELTEEKSERRGEV